MGKRIVIGLGTGRCGTVSFSKLLELQGIISTHEYTLLPWVFDQRKIDQMVDILRYRRGDIVADTAFYYLPYVDYLIERFDDIKFVCLKRSMEPTIASYMTKTEGRNHWANDSVSLTDEYWDKCYPTYTIHNKEHAIREYWKEYRNTSIRLMDQYPDNFRIFKYDEVLGDEDCQKSMFDFIGLPSATTHLDIVMNKSNT